MSPGAAEEAGKAVSGFMDALKAQPLSLALVVMNLALLLLFWYIARTASENRQKEFQAVLQSHKETNELLSRCVVPGARSDFRLQSDESRPIQLPPLPRPRPDEAPKE